MALGGFVGFAPTARSSGDAGANSIFLTPVVAQQSGSAVAVLLDCLNATPATTFKALIYDSAHSTLLASSATFTSSVAGYNRFVLTTPLALVAGTTYYVGYVCSTSFSVTIQSGGGASWYVSGGQSVTTPANPLVGGVTAANNLMVALELDGSGSTGQGWGTDQASGVTLSSANALATFSATANRGARSTVTRGPGTFKWYAEVVVGGTINNNVGIGLVAADWGVTQGTGVVQYVHWLLPTGTLSSSSGNPALGLTYVSGDTIGIAYDPNTNQLWFNKNNGSWFGSSSTAGSPSGGAGGSTVESTLWPLALAVATGATGTAATFTLHDLAANQAFAPPFGFTPWSTVVSSQINVQSLVRESVVAGPGIANVQGLIRESPISRPGVAYAGGITREALISSPGVAQAGGLVREALIAGVGLSVTISAGSSVSATPSVTVSATALSTTIESQSKIQSAPVFGFSVSGRITAQSGISAFPRLTTFVGGNINAQSSLAPGVGATRLYSTITAQSGLSGYLSLRINVSGRITAGSSLAVGTALPENLSKLNSYVVMLDGEVDLGKLESYVVLGNASSTEELSKLNAYVIVTVKTSIDVSKLQSYVVLKFPPSIEMSKAESYVVLGRPPREIMTKLNSYVVLATPIPVIIPGELKPYFEISST